MSDRLEKFYGKMQQMPYVQKLKDYLSKLRKAENGSTDESTGNEKRNGNFKVFSIIKATFLRICLVLYPTE